MNGEKGQKLKTTFGLPQVWVILALLFILFIVGCYANVKSKKVKFADGGTILRTGNNWIVLVKQLEERQSYIALFNYIYH